MKKYGLVLVVVVPLSVLVLIKSFTGGHFRNDASKWTGPSISQANLIAREHLDSLDGKPILVVLDSSTDIPAGLGETVNIPARSILNKVNLKKLRDHKGSIVLVSADPALSARIWMLLSQLGNKNLYILTDSTDNEVLKYKFRPDTLIMPEL